LCELVAVAFKFAPSRCSSYAITWQWRSCRLQVLERLKDGPTAVAHEGPFPAAKTRGPASVVVPPERGENEQSHCRVGMSILWEEGHRADCRHLMQPHQVAEEPVQDGQSESPAKQDVPIRELPRRCSKLRQPGLECSSAARPEAESTCHLSEIEPTATRPGPDVRDTVQVNQRQLRTFVRIAFRALHWRDLHHKPGAIRQRTVPAYSAYPPNFSRNKASSRIARRRIKNS
jgi:hypothetical protein